MKILYVTNRDDIYGGAQCLKELITFVREYPDVEVALLNPVHNTLNEWCDKNNIENYSAHYYGWMYSKHDRGMPFIVKYLSYFFRYHFLNPFVIKRIEKMIDINKFDIIHTNTSTISIGATIANKYGIKHVWHLREFGKEDMNFIPLVPRCIGKMKENADRFIAISDVVKESWIRKGIDKNKVVRIYDGIVGTKLLGPKEILDEEKIRIVFAGSITPFKDQDQLIEAFNNMTDLQKKQFTVDIWGSGKTEYVEALKRKVAMYGLSDVIRFRGYSKNLYKELVNYDVGVNCSNSEAFGRVTVEYMMSGLLTLASDTGANTELIINNESGILYKKNDTEDLKRNILWIAENRSQCKQIALYGYHYGMVNYTIEKNIKLFYDLYRNILK